MFGEALDGSLGGGGGASSPVVFHYVLIFFFLSRGQTLTKDESGKIGETNLTTPWRRRGAGRK